MTKLGYTFYPKDWRSSMNVLELSLQEKGFYRELIDECFIQMSAKIQLNERTFCRLHGINSRSFEKVLRKLQESSLILIENFDERIISIPSIINRLGVIGMASEGGKKSSRKGVGNGQKKVTKLKLKQETKTKTKIENNKPFDFYRSLIDLGANKDLVDAWLKIRKKGKAVNSEIAFKGFLREVNLSGLPIDQVLTKCCEKSWKCFESAWIDNGNNQFNKKEVKVASEPKKPVDI